jgi:hypothetical protein
MAIVVQFVKDYAPWVYGACAFVALWYLRVAISARRERRYAQYSLEREAALNRTYAAWSVAISLLIVMGVVYFISNIVSPVVQPLVDDLRTPTVSASLARLSPSPTLPVLMQTPSAAPSSSPTAAPATPRPRPTVAPSPTSQQATPTPGNRAPAPQCADERAALTAPGVGAEVSGFVAIMGTAQHERFKFYKLELTPVGPNPVWSYFDGGERMVQNGQLGTLNAAALPPGSYLIRLVVVDQTGNYPPPCQTTVVIR